jgi:hypothetical protein
VVPEQWLYIIGLWSMRCTWQWRYGSESRSVLGTTAVVVYLWIFSRAWDKSSGCVVVNRCPCVVHVQWFSVSLSVSFRGT